MDIFPGIDLDLFFDIIFSLGLLILLFLGLNYLYKSIFKMDEEDLKDIIPGLNVIDPYIDNKYLDKNIDSNSVRKEMKTVDDGYIN